MAKTICYFGIYSPNYGRSRIYLKGFKDNGVKVIDCWDNSPGPLKFLRLFLKHWRIRNDYDYILVGYPGHIVVWLAKLISTKPVIFDALCTMHEGMILSRSRLGLWGVGELYVKFIDWLAVKCADVCLVETEHQKAYFEKKFGQSSRYEVIYTGADDSVFFVDDKIPKKEKFTVVFRGKFLPEAGVKYVVEAAELLQDEGVDFLLIGNGFLEKEIGREIEKRHLKNLKWIKRDSSYEDLRKMMSECHVSLGQFENHERLERTIPHKAFESLALGLPYITARMPAVSEILEDQKNCLFVNPADPKDLADKILKLKTHPESAQKITQNGMEMYHSRLTPRALTKEILEKI